MDYEKFKKYEYKSPSYELVNRGERCTAEDSTHVKNRRYYYDPAQGSYVSKQGKKDAVSMLFCGDLLCQEKMIRRFRRADGSYDFSLCFEFVKPLFESADFVAGNLETPISHTAPYRGEIISHEGPYFCNAPVEYLEAVSGAGFDMLTTENNHTLDAGVRGLVETIENMDRFGFIHTGTFTKPEKKYVIVDVCGFKVGFTAFGVKYNAMVGNLTQEGQDVLLNSYSRKRAEELFREMKEKGAEYIVCFPHWGKEYTEVLAPVQKKMAAELTNIGYDLVVGAHSHVIQKFRFVNEKPVLFSLGNLMSHLNSGTVQEHEFTVMMNLNLSRDEEGNIVPEFKFVPCKILRNFMSIPYTVLPINEDLKLTREYVSKLKLALKTIRGRLGCKAERVDAKFPVSPEAKERFEEIRETFSDRAAVLVKQTADARTEKKEPGELPKKGLTDKFQRYHRTADALYKIYKDHAELAELERETEGVTLPGKVEDLPVLTVYGRPSGNNTTRLVYLGEPTVTVEKNAFRNFTAMESIRLFSNLETIGDNAFENCVSMTGIILPGSLKCLGDEVFLNCGKLLSVKIPPSVKTIGKNAFKGCPKVTIYCEEGSYADSYAKDHGIAVSYMPLSESAAASREVTEGAAEAVEIAEDTKPVRSKECAEPVRNVGSAGVVMGPMNGPEDKHPKPIIAACYYLGKPLPASAKCGHQPSYYIGKNTISGKLSAIKKLLGDRMSEVDSNELEKWFKRFRKAYKGQAKLEYTETDMAVYFADWLVHANPRGFSCTDYFVFEFYNKESAVRETFMGNDLVKGFRQRVYVACSNDSKYRHCFRLKSKFNQTFAKYVNRDWVDATTCTFEEFAAFLEKHEKFFVKPVGGTGGVGARVIRRDSDTPEKLFEICKTEELIVEELVKQHKDLAEFNASTLNTIRVNTLLCADGTPRITLTFARFGRSGSDADNFHAGGVGGIVDIDTGVMITDAINQHQLTVTQHPDSHKQFIGFQYPHWEDIKAAVCDAARSMPWVRHIGWDVAVTEKGTVELIEGNCRPNFDGLQSPDQIGRIFRYKKYIEEIEAMKGIKYHEVEPLVIDITGMETDQ